MRALFWLESSLRRIIGLGTLICTLQSPVVAQCVRGISPGLLLLPPESPLAATFNTASVTDSADAQQSTITSALAGLKRGTVLRVSMRDGGTFEGPFARVEGAACLFDDANKTAIDIARIDGVWKRKSKSSKGLLIGAILLSTLTTVYLADGGAYPAEYLLGFAGASVVGGLAGAGIGSAFHEWEMITSSDSESSSPWASKEMQ